MRQLTNAALEVPRYLHTELSQPDRLTDILTGRRHWPGQNAARNKPESFEILKQDPNSHIFGKRQIPWAILLGDFFRPRQGYSHALSPTIS